MQEVISASVSHAHEAGQKYKHAEFRQMLLELRDHAITAYSKVDNHNRTVRRTALEAQIDTYSDLLERIGN